MDSHDQEAVAAVRAVFDQVIADGLAPESVTGATDEQVEAYAAAQGVTAVPAAVREVLRLIGVDHGLWQVGSSFGVDAVGRDAKRYAQGPWRRTAARSGTRAGCWCWSCTRRTRSMSSTAPTSAIRIRRYG